MLQRVLLVLILLSVALESRAGNPADLLSRAVAQVRKPGELPADMDSALTFLRQAAAQLQRVPDKKMNGVLALAYSYYQEENKLRAVAEKNADLAIRIFNQLPQCDSLLGEAYVQRERFTKFDSAHVKEKENYAAQAALSFHRAGSQLREAETRQYLGDLLINDRQYERAKAELQQSLQIKEGIPGSRKAEVYDLLGYANDLTGDLQEAVRYGLLACREQESAPDSPQMLTICSRLSLTFSNLKDLKNAEIYARKAMAVAAKINEINYLYYVANLAASALAAQEKYPEALALLQEVVRQHPKPQDPDYRVYIDLMLVRVYVHLNNLGAARESANRLVADIPMLVGLGELKQDLYNNLVGFYTASGEYNLAEKYLHDQAALAKESKSKLYEHHNEDMWFRLDTARRQYQAATAHLLRVRALEDTMLNEKNLKEISHLEIQYETEKKETALRLRDQNIKVLQQKQQLQQLSLNRASLLRNVMIAGGCLLLLILALLFRQNKMEKTVNKIITGKNDAMQVLLAEKESLLEDKELLMKEIHHRVKNNLHMISSLLESQSAYLENEALYAIQKSQHRVQAISLIHQKLYLNDNVTSVKMDLYIREIVTYLRDSFLSDERIIFELDIDPVELDVAQVVPLGLIINEAVTNALKYAFPGGRRGKVYIALKEDAQQVVTLTVADNGVGLPDALITNAQQSPSLGLRLIRGLGKNLQGICTLHNDGGTTLTLVFNNAHHASPLIVAGEGEPVAG